MQDIYQDRARANRKDTKMTKKVIMLESAYVCWCGKKSWVVGTIEDRPSLKRGCKHISVVMGRTGYEWIIQKKGELKMARLKLIGVVVEKTGDRQVGESTISSFELVS